MRGGNRHGSKVRDRARTTQRPDEMGGDMTTTVTLAKGTAAVFVPVDHVAAECIGIRVAAFGTRFEALELFR